MSVTSVPPSQEARGTPWVLGSKVSFKGWLGHTLCVFPGHLSPAWVPRRAPQQLSTALAP